jgi:hypothetical protein
MGNFVLAFRKISQTDEPLEPEIPEFGIYVTGFAGDYAKYNGIYESTKRMSDMIMCEWESENGKIVYDSTIFKWQIRDKINDIAIAETVNIQWSSTELPSNFEWRAYSDEHGTPILKS